jgi:hypothetical protein
MQFAHLAGLGPCGDAASPDGLVVGLVVTSRRATEGVGRPPQPAAVEPRAVVATRKTKAWTVTPPDKR